MTVNKVLSCTGALVFDYALYYRSISVLPITERTLIKNLSVHLVSGTFDVV